MATKSKQQTRTQSATLEFDEQALQSTMQEFLKDEKKENPGILNFATIAGFAMLFICLTYLIQLMGLTIGPDLSTFVSVLPLIGGILVTLVGFGFFVGDRKDEKKNKKGNRSQKYSYNKEFDVVGGEESFKKNHFKTKNAKESNLNNDLDVDFEQFVYGSSESGKKSVNSYAHRESKKLMKSRTDKKWAGVCGGIAKYFGISSTVVRLLFVIATFMGYGSAILIYIGLSIAMPKEPVDLLDDF